MKSLRNWESFRRYLVHSLVVFIGWLYLFSIIVVIKVFGDLEHLDEPRFLYGDCDVSKWGRRNVRGIMRYNCRSDLDLFIQFTSPLDPKYRKIAHEDEIVSRRDSIHDVYQRDYKQFIQVSLDRNLTNLNHGFLLIVSPFRLTISPVIVVMFSMLFLSLSDLIGNSNGLPIGKMYVLVREISRRKWPFQSIISHDNLSYH